MSSPGNKKKNKRRSVSVQVKLKALDDMKKGTPTRVIAEKLNLSISTVNAWKRTEKTMRSWEKMNGTVPTYKKRLRRADNPIVDEATWAWCEQNRDSGCPVSGPMIKAQAMNFFKHLGGSKSFEASEGWLTNFKHRHGIKISISGEQLSADQEAATSYNDEFLKIIKKQELTPDQVFNCDETGLNFRQIPRTNLHTQIEPRDTDVKIEEERYTVMACSNASGTIKLPLLVIGKTEKTRSIHTLSQLPVIYKCHRNLWMSADIFEQWFHQSFVPYVTAELTERGLPIKAVLFIDNSCIRTKKIADDDIQLNFLPPNTTSIIQPMDLGCLQNFKLLYRLKLMNYIIEKFAKGKTLDIILKKVTIREVLLWAADAWGAVSRSTIIKSWKPLWPEVMEMKFLEEALASPSNPSSTELNQLVKKFHEALIKQKGHELISESDVHDWLNCGTLLSPDECMDPDEIVEIFRDKRDTEKENTSGKTNEIIGESTSEITNDITDDINDEMTDEMLCEMTLQEAEINLERLIKFCEDRGKYSKLQMLALNEVHDSMIQELQSI